MWPLFLGTDTPAPLMLPDSVQKANFAETVHKIANLDFETVLQNLLSESVWILLKITLALAIYFIGRWILRRIVRLLWYAGFSEVFRTEARKDGSLMLWCSGSKKEGPAEGALCEVVDAGGQLLGRARLEKKAATCMELRMAAGELPDGEIPESCYVRLSAPRN